MRIRLFGLAASAAVGIATLAGAPLHTAAATPAAGTLSAASPTLSWANSGPMQGSAPSRRNLTCEAPSACDDFTLTIATGSDVAPAVHVTTTASGGAIIVPLLYAPGCSTAPTDTSGCYGVEGNSFSLFSPKSGQYTLRMACKACPPNSGYTVQATYNPDEPPRLPDAGDQSYGWTNAMLPGSDTTATGEPGISVNKLGHVIVNTFGPTVWISTDDGGTWSQPNSTIDTVGCPSGDADAVVSNDDTYYADNLCLAGGSNLSYTSRDGGATWNPDRKGMPAPVSADSDRQWYALDPVNPGVVYFNYHDLEGPNIWTLKSTDYGQTWTQVAPITAGASNYSDSSQGNTAARAVIDPTDPNTIDVFYTSNLAQNSATALPTDNDFQLRQINLARSTNGGQSWTNYLLHDFGQSGGQDNTIAHEFSSATMDSAGNAYIAVSERLGNATQTHVVLGVLPKGATSIDNWTQVDQGGLGANVFPSIAAGDPGNVDVTWYGSTAQDNNDTGAQWSEMFAQSFDALSAAPTFVQSRVSGDGPTHAADICLAGTLCLATGGNRNLSDFQSIAVDPCGAALIVYDNDATGSGNTTFAKQTAGTSVLNTVPAGCTVVGAPSTVVPETRSTVALPAAAVGVVGLAVAIRRCRRLATGSRRSQ